MPRNREEEARAQADREQEHQHALEHRRTITVDYGAGDHCEVFDQPADSTEAAGLGTHPKRWLMIAAALAVIALIPLSLSKRPRSG